VESGVLVGVKAGNKTLVEVEAREKTLVEVEAEPGSVTDYVHFAIGLSCMGGSTVLSAKKKQFASNAGLAKICQTKIAWSGSFLTPIH
jgi:hypothetical protein